ncbi:Hsp70 family protein [Longispora sp. NPDC051575]|uniref:Hsp70 family protein n=1 Tax=Longispora sp. NPDC051575 TaxID=3154943 RepID=UPI00342F3181
MRLAVDLGTSHTVAVVRRDGQPVRALLFDGSPMLPSGVFIDPAGELLTGKDAERLARTAPDRFEPHPKRGVDEGFALLGQTEVAVPDLLAAILRRVSVEARHAGVDPAGGLILTCPADWGKPRRDVLREAARRAGLHDVRLVEEPVAAATYCLDVSGQQVSVGQVLAVFDFGGGTLDVTVVRRDQVGLSVLATGGLDDLGGLDVDAALVGHVGQLLALHDPDAWRRLAAPDTTAEQRDRRAFWSEVRSAKEMLSRASSAPVQVPGREEALHLTREELNRVAGPLIDRAVDETRRVLQRAGVEPAALAGIFLVGGSSRIPLVASRLHARFGVAPMVPEQPELPVAHGGLLCAGATDAQMSATPMSAPPISAPPVSGPPVSGQPYPGAPYQGGPGAAPPMSGPGAAAPVGYPGGYSAPGTPPGGYPGQPATGQVPYPGQPTTGSVPAPPPGTGSALPSGYPGQVSAPPLTPPSGYPGQIPGPRTGGHPGLPPVFGTKPEPLTYVPPRRPRNPVKFLFRFLLPVVIVIVIAAAAGFGPAKNLLKGFVNKTNSVTNGLGGDLGGPGTSGKLDQTQNVALVNTGDAAVVVSGDVAYYASVKAGGTDVVALPVKGGAELWKQSVKMAESDISINVVGGVVLVGGRETRSGINAADGKVLWDKKPWTGRRDLAYIGSDVVVETTGGGTDPAVTRVDLKTGNNKWTRPQPGKDLLIIDNRLAFTNRVWGAGAEGVTPAHAEYAESLGAQPEFVMVDEPKGKVYVIDADGKDKVVKPIALETEHWTVFNGLLVGLQADTATIVAYKVADLSKAWEAPYPEGTSFGLVTPCGPTLICFPIQNSGQSGSTLTAFQTTDGTKAWSKDFGSGTTSLGCLALGGKALCGSLTFGYVSDGVLIDPEKGEKSAKSIGKFIVIRAASAQRYMFQTYETSGWVVGVGDVGSTKVTKSQPVGKEQIKSASISGDTVAVIDGERHVRVLRIS